MRRLISEIDGGTYMEPAKTTMAQYLDRWLDHIKTQVSPRSHERYGEIARKNLAPLLGAVDPVQASTGANLRCLRQGARPADAGTGQGGFRRAPFTTCTAC